MAGFKKLDVLKQTLDAFRPLAPEIVKNLHEDLVLRWTYNSNAIEGNTLTLKETKVALEGITIGGKTMREHIEAINHREAILFVEDLVKKNKPLSEWQIRAVHQLILKNIDDEHAGAYRKTNVLISGADHIPPDAGQVKSQMKSFIDWCGTAGGEMHPVEKAARVNAELVKIHPFVDGNGRTSRLLMNLELMKAGYPTAVLPVEKRLEYYESLDRAHTTNDYEPFFDLVCVIVAAGFEPYWKVLGVRA